MNRLERKTSYLISLFKSLKEEELRMKDYERLHAIHGSRRGRSNARVTCPHCKKTGHTEEGCWPLHPELASEHLQEKFRKAKETGSSSASSAVRLLQRSSAVQVQSAFPHVSQPDCRKPSCLRSINLLEEYKEGLVILSLSLYRRIYHKVPYASVPEES